jgi:adenylate cyclase
LPDSDKYNKFLQQGGHMSIVPEEFKAIERKDWHLWILLSILFLFLTTFVVLLVFYSDISEIYEQNVSKYTLNLLFVGYVGLSLLFLAYMIFQEVSIKKLRLSLVEEKISLSIVLGNRYQELKSLFAVSTLVNSEVDLPKIFQMISKTALACLEGDQSSLMIYDENRGKLYCAAAHGSQTEFVRNATVDIGKSVAGWVVKHGKPLLLGKDNIEDFGFTDLIKKEREIHSSLCVPLKVRGKVKGVLNVNRLTKDKTFTEEDLKLLSIFAENAAVSIEKAELWKEAHNKTLALESTLDEVISSQSDLVQLEKMKALNELVGGMAEDFKNILSAILGSSELLQKNIPEDLKKYLTVIQDNAYKGLEKIDKLSTLYKSQEKQDHSDAELKRIVS